jgi:hypothetical protein
MGSAAGNRNSKRSFLRPRSPADRARHAVVALVVPLGLASCGYSFSGSALPAHVKTIGIPVFQNDTLEYGVEKELTDRVTEAFIQDNHLKVVGEHEADAVLVGRIIGYENKVFSYTGSQTAEEYIVKIRIAVSLKDQVANKELWKDDSLERTATYAVVDRPGKPAMTEQDGRQAAIQDLSDVIISRTLEEW